MPNLSGRSKTALYAVAGFAVGAIAWSGYLWTLAFLLGLPVLLHCGTTTIAPLRNNGAAILAYHAGATWSLLPGAHLFFGVALRPLDALYLWAAVILVLSLPWVLTTRFRTERVWWGIPIAMTTAIFLPTGIANPITAAGVLFPGTAWVGLVFTLILFGAIAAKPKQTLLIAGCLALACNLVHRGTPAASSDFAAIDTQYGGSGFHDVAAMKEYADAQDIQQRALDSRATVIVFPESVIHRWNDATDMFWQDTYDELRRQGKTILVGAEQSVPDSRTREYRNVIKVRGVTNLEFRQRIPLPYAMWRPLSRDGVPLYIFGPSTITIAGREIAPLVCYEQLLVEPVLKAMARRPAILVGLANDYWARDTSIPAIQHSALTSWSRLFWVPAISAVNQ
jgi:hypothetical protein